MEEKEEKKENVQELIRVIEDTLKKKKHKKNKKKQKKYYYPYVKENFLESLLYYIFFFGSIGLCCFLGYQILLPSDITLVIEDKPYNLIKKGSDTTSMIFVNNGNGKSPQEYKKILAHYHHNHPIVCLHHIDIDDNHKYRICLMERIYLLINPSISITNDNKFIKDISEESISCKNETLKKRFHCVNMHWLDENNHQLSGNICGDTAIALQMMMDEFEGNKHC